MQPANPRVNGDADFVGELADIDVQHGSINALVIYTREPATRESIALGMQQRAGSRPVQR
jgi:hypothetical protein